MMIIPAKPRFLLTRGLFLLALVAIAWTSCSLMGNELVARQKTRVEILEAVAVTGPAGESDRSLRVTMLAPAVDNCARLTLHLLYRCEGGDAASGPGNCTGQPTYYPLGSGLTAVGFGLAAAQVSTGNPFVVVMGLPSGMNPGEYEYVQRSLFICTWFNGLVSRRISRETQSVPVQVE